MAKWLRLDEDSEPVAQPPQKRHCSRRWLSPSSEDEAAVPSRRSGVPCSWQAVVSSDDDNATCPIIRQPAPSGQRPPEGSRHDDDACPIIRQPALARQTPGGSRHWAESDSDVETLAHAGTKLTQCPTEPRKIDINVEMLKVCGGHGAITIRGNLSVNDKNGMSRERVNAVLCQPCSCAKNCYAKIHVEDLLEVCTWWHGHMTAGERSFLLNVQYGDNPSEEDTIAERTHWHLCSVRVCYKAICSLLGISRRTGTKYAHGALDMRTSLGDDGGPCHGRQQREAAQSLRVHQFFLELYHSAAESLPHEHYMIKGSCIMIRYLF